MQCDTEADLPGVSDGVGEVLYCTRNIGHVGIKEAVGEKFIDGGECLPGDGSSDALGPDDVQEGGKELIGVDLVEGEGGSQHALQVQERLQQSRVKRVRGSLKKVNL